MPRKHKRSTRGLVRFILFLVVLFAGAELMRLSLLFYRMNPLLGFAVAGFFAVTLLVVFIRVQRRKTLYRIAFLAPPLPDLPVASFYELREYCWHLHQRLRQLSHNPYLSAELASLARRQAHEIDGVLHAHPLIDDLVRTIEQTEKDILPPLFAALREKASALLPDFTRDSMANGSLQQMRYFVCPVVLIRSIAIVSRIMSFYMRPLGVLDQCALWKDILRAMCRIEALKLHRLLIHGLYSNLPALGRECEWIGQSLSIGFLTTLAGNLVIDRCECARKWTPRNSLQRLCATAKDPLINTRNLFNKDILPESKKRLQALLPAGTTETPGFWESVQFGIRSTTDPLINSLAGFIPVMSVSVEGDIPTGAWTDDDEDPENEHRQGRPSRHRRRSHPKGVGRVLRTIGQRIRYSLFGGR